MSQKKVDQYKKEKAVRKQTVKKQKMEAMLMRICGVIVCAAIIGWAGYSGYRLYESKKPAQTSEISLDSLSEYEYGLSTEAE